MVREKRVLGEEKIMFTDGEEMTIKIHAVPNFEVAKQRRLCRENIIKDNKIVDVRFKEEDYHKGVLKLAVGLQIKNEDYDFIETDISKILEKYFNKEVSPEKKDKSTDMPEQNQEN